MADIKVRIAKRVAKELKDEPFIPRTDLPDLTQRLKKARKTLISSTPAELT